MSANSENSKLVFCRSCGKHTAHLPFEPFHEKKERKFSKISQIIYCDVCEETILEIYTKYADESETQSMPERYPAIRENFKKAIDIKNEEANSSIYSSYLNCVDSYNQGLFRASFLYLTITVNLLLSLLLQENGNHQTRDKTLKYKLNLLRTKSRKNKHIEKFSTFFSNILKDFEQCVQPEFNPAITEIESAIDALSLFLHYKFNVMKMSDMTLDELDAIYQRQPQTENPKR